MIDENMANHGKKTDTPCNELLCKNAGQSIGISEKMHQRLGKPPIKLILAFTIIKFMSNWSTK